MKLLDEVNHFYYKMSLYELQFMNHRDYYNGLSYNSMLYLNVVEQQQKCTVSQLAELLHITKSAVTIKVGELVKQGYLVKTQSQEDRRVYYLELNLEMKSIFEEYDSIFLKIEKKLRVTYTLSEMDLFCRMLNDMSSYQWGEELHE